MFLHIAPLLYIPTVLRARLVFLFVFNFSFLLPSETLALCRVLNSSDSDKPHHYSHFCMLSTHITLTPFPCQNPCSLLSCPSSILPFTYYLRLLERLQIAFRNTFKTETISKISFYHTSKINPQQGFSFR